jgi:hypothetical protein
MAESMPQDPFVFQLPSRERAARRDDVRLAWREACCDLRLAYLRWREAGPARTEAAFAAYVDAIGREAAAAAAVAGLTPAPAASRRCGSSPPS